ncbi:MAG: beta-lactamase family protein [Myxococcales bacterium]|nr:beta-lactamase family protein [Myxococcales bacterium]
MSLPHDELEIPAAWPANGRVARGYEPVARCFEDLLSSGREIGASFAVYHRGRCVVDLWGGLADVASARPWTRDTRIVVFSVTKGLAAMALNMLSDRGLLEWDAPVGQYWPELARHGKERLTVRTLFQHRGGLPYLDVPFTLSDFTDPSRVGDIRRALELQRPAWEPERSQGYHALTYGMYATELFARIAGEPMGLFLEREVFEPLGSDARLGTPARFDAQTATLYPPADGDRIRRMLGAMLMRPRSTEARVARATIAPRSIPRRAFLNPHPGPSGLLAYNDLPARRAALAWASATASAQGVARAYLPFASGGAFEGRRFLKPPSVSALHDRGGWSERDRVLNKPLGWTRGFLKEEPHIFSPARESFGHAGLGGALGWCDPVHELTWGYALNRLDWHVRSPRAIALCRALYACEAVRER